MTGTKPSIQSDRTIAIISFPLKSAIQSNSISNNNGPIYDGINDPIRSLPSDLKKLLVAIKLNPEKNYFQLAQQIKSTESTVKRKIQRLKELKFIRREGSNKNGKWVITKELPLKNNEA